MIEEREKLRNIVRTMQKEVTKIKQNSLDDKRVMEHLMKEKEMLNKNILRHQGWSQVTLYFYYIQ